MTRFSIVEWLKKKLPLILFILSSVVLVYGYGVYSYKYKTFPLTQAKYIVREVRQVLHNVDGDLYIDKSAEVESVSVYLPDKLSNRLLLLMGVDIDRKLMIRIIDRSGNVIHELHPDWFDIWDDDEGSFPANRRPISKPGTMLHGVDLLSNGDLVVNFEHLSTMRMDMCGKVVWKLDNFGHHSVHVDEDDTIWVPAESYIVEPPTGFRNHEVPLRSWEIQHISPNGVILDTVPVIKIFEDNDLYGLLLLSTTENGYAKVSGDTLHLNDVETYPSDFESSVFREGDIMISLRNINTVIVMDPVTYRIKYRMTGETLRQHDPDFEGGDTISIFDNNNLSPKAGGPLASRIVEFNARTSKKRIMINGAGKYPFFSNIMGEHEKLDNGNTLIASTKEGKVLEFTQEGRLAWEYNNRVSGSKVGLITAARELPGYMNADYFEAIRSRCK